MKNRKKEVHNYLFLSSNGRVRRGLSNFSAMKVFKIFMKMRTIFTFNYRVNKFLKMLINYKYASNDFVFDNMYSFSPIVVFPIRTACSR